ncbi:MAG: ABC transporter ATP-binding protein [Candidatus Heimdallarchaeota archaeon]|nr:MAG: nitrate ABC transporter ATP-binding protein [Candidatus Gerdarchaeota archaeon]RLI71714.1 MAG: nitrate ABC transporter ATP-binding protein [Candidatus Gerdarchaeota archaeon]
MSEEKSNKIKIKAIDVRKEFKEGKRKVIALDNLNLKIEEGEFAVIVGPSGCGKSTFLYMIAGFENVTEGKILLDNIPVDKPGNNRGFVFQEFALFPWRTVEGNIRMPLDIAGNLEEAEIKAKVQEFIELVGLEGFEHAYPHTLSGGMKQRVGLARALVYDPDVLLLDEPFGALDAQTRKLMQQELIRIWQKVSSLGKKKTVVFITHSVIEAVYLADKVYVMSARPGHIKAIIDIDIPRPRSYTSDEFIHKREEVLKYLEEEVLIAAQQNREGLHPD